MLINVTPGSDALLFREYCGVVGHSTMRKAAVTKDRKNRSCSVVRPFERSKPHRNSSWRQNPCLEKARKRLSRRVFIRETAKRRSRYQKSTGLGLHRAGIHTQEAIERYRERKTDVTLMDLRVPHIGGIQCHTITIRSEFPDARIIITDDVFRRCRSPARSCSRSPRVECAGHD
jgi:hypothetical protein